MLDFNHTTNEELLQLLYGLIRNWEHEVIEFKQVSDNKKHDEIGQYFSALSNEANLKGTNHGWLIFGIHDKTKKVISTDYRDTHGLEVLKNEIANNASGRLTFTDVYEVFEGDKRVIMFKIPAALKGVPTAWKGHWYGREGESLSPLSQDEIDRIRGQALPDWSSRVIEDSDIKYLDSEAIQIARENYKRKKNREHIKTEVDKMTDEDFLTKLMLIKDGKLTNAAMVLLGNPECDNRFDGHARVMWRLYGSNGIVKDYAELRIPFITVVDRAYDKIRKLTYRYLPNRKTLFTTETEQYNIDLIKELLNNCVAHMDYTSGGRIYLDEFEDTIVISNPGGFIPGDVRKVLNPGYRAPYYRNQLIAESMSNFDMIDTVQMGILKVYNIQRERYFPLPDYDVENAHEVSVRVYGKILSTEYTRLLFDRADLTIDTVYFLDRVQKRLPLEKEQYKMLKDLNLIEGKAPNYYISLGVADIIDERTQYTRNKAMDDKYYKDLVINYLQQWEKGKRSDFIKLLSDKLPDVLDHKQKVNKVRNLLASMSRSGLIELDDKNQRTGSWQLTKND